MPVTEHDARAITFLALRSRPHGAPRWDEAGTYANIMKVADRSLPSVVIAVIQAAEDRKAVTPGVIPTAGPHWRDPESAPPKTAPDTWDPHDICTACSKTRAVCEARKRCDCGKDSCDNHEFTSRAVNAQRTGRPVEAVERIVDDLRDALHPTTAEEATNG